MHPKARTIGVVVSWSVEASQEAMAGVTQVSCDIHDDRIALFECKRCKQRFLIDPSRRRRIFFPSGHSIDSVRFARNRMYYHVLYKTCIVIQQQQELFK